MTTLTTFVAAAACLVVIAIWVRRTYDTSHALVMGATSVLTLSLVWVGHEVLPVRAWTYQNFSALLLLFSIPTAVGAALLWWKRGLRQPGIHWGLLLLLFWLAMPTLLYVTTLPIGGPSREIGRLVWWALAGIAVYVSIPLIYAALSRQSIRRWGLSLEFIRTEARLFLLIAPAVAAVAWFVAADERFAASYPFLNDTSNIRNLLMFEALYGLSFVALEFYFRGFMVHAGFKAIGAHAVPLMSIFYCFIHIGKPLPEVVASLVGGLVLGYLSLRLQSIAVGVAFHLTMAWGVDAAVLLHGL